MANLLNPNYSDIQSTGGDYATPVLWEADTDNDLVTATTSEIGRMAAETWTEAVSLEGATTSVDYSRCLTYQVGAGPYDLAADSGPKISVTAGADTARNIYISEEFAVIQGVCAETDVNGKTAIRAVWAAAGANGALFESCCSRLTNSVNAGWGIAFVLTSSGASVIRNSIATVYGTVLGEGISGIAIVGPSSSDNCTVYGLQSNFDVYSSAVIRNAASFDATSACFKGTGTFSYCVSSDATATGTGSVTGETAADCFTDAAGGDFSPKATGALYDAGTDLSGTFTTDITGATRTLWSIGAYDAPPVVAGVTANIEKNHSTTEYVPAHFSFNGWGSTPVSGGINECKFKWTVSGGSEHDGVYTGPNLGLVFETAGTFTVRLDVVDAAGNAGDTSTTVTVAAPTYDNVIYVSTDGSDSNDGLTDGAPKLTFGAAATALLAAHSAGEHSCIYLRKGDTFTCSSAISGPASSNGTLYIKPYGSGSIRPVVTSSTSSIISQTNSSAQYYGWRIVDVDIHGAGSAIPVTLLADDSTASRGLDFVAVRSTWSMTGSGSALFTCNRSSASQYITTYGGLWPGYSRTGNVAFMDVDMTTNERYCIYGAAQWFTFLRGSAVKPVTGNGEHCFRFEWIRGASIRDALMSSPSDNTTILRWASITFSGYKVSSCEVSVVGCAFEVGTYLAIHAGYNEAWTTPDLTLINPGRLFIANNGFDDHPTEPYLTNPFTPVEIYGHECAVVGNTIQGKCGGVSIKAHRDEVAVDSSYSILVANNSMSTTESNMSLVGLSATYPVTLHVAGNAVYGPSSSARLIRGSSTSGDLERITSDHNVADSTAWAVNVGSAGTRTLAQWQTDSSQDANSVAADPAFADPANDDWSIGVDSPCYDAGENIGASWLTREGTERSGTWDIGAYEIPAASPTSENMSGYLNLANIRVRAGQTLVMAFTGTGNAKGRYILTVELQ